jgi:hypothetical protein
MRNLLCQVCAGPADQTDLGTLWLLADRPDHHDDWPGWPEEMATPEPPICLRCAHLSIDVCPALRRGWIAIRVARPTLSGIRGLLYTPGPSCRPRSMRSSSPTANPSPAGSAAPNWYANCSAAPW